MAYSCFSLISEYMQTRAWTIHRALGRVAYLRVNRTESKSDRSRNPGQNQSQSLFLVARVGVVEVGIGGRSRARSHWQRVLCIGKCIEWRASLTLPDSHMFQYQPVVLASSRHTPAAPCTILAPWTSSPSGWREAPARGIVSAPAVSPFA